MKKLFCHADRFVWSPTMKVRLESTAQGCSVIDKAHRITMFPEVVIRLRPLFAIAWRGYFENLMWLICEVRAPGIRFSFSCSIAMTFTPSGASVFFTSVK
jgi:hypothetical protein